MLAVVREGVANAVRYSGGREIQVDVDVGGELTVQIVDDGTGIDDESYDTACSVSQARLVNSAGR